MGGDYFQLWITTHFVVLLKVAMVAASLFPNSAKKICSISSL